MEFKTQVCSFQDISTDVLAIPVWECDTVAEGFLRQLNDVTNGLLATIIGTLEMRGKVGDIAYIQVVTGLKARRLLLVGIGKKENLSPGSIRRFAGTAIRFIGKKGMGKLAFVMRSGIELDIWAKALVEGSLVGFFESDTYKTQDKSDNSIKEITLALTESTNPSFEKALQSGNIIGESLNFSRILVNEPGTTMTPTMLANKAEETAKEFGLGIEILDESKMQELGMGALLGVSRGSEEEARLIVLNYKTDTKQAETVAIVGKGITFDSGGLSLKTAEGMEKMKYDMAGGAAVLGTMRAIAQLKPKVNVLGIIPASENMPSGSAIKPGDVLKSMAGKTIEVLNTDAEGRLILADAIAYAKKLGANKIVDLATLTSAISIALGTLYTGLFSSNQELADQILKASKRVDEKIWQLPLDEEYKKLIKSDIADLKNTGGKYAGSITAAYFLKEFAEDTPWVHLDIAGTAWNSDSKPYIAKGPTGAGMYTLIEWITGL